MKCFECEKEIGDTNFCHTRIQFIEQGHQSNSSGLYLEYQIPFCFTCFSQAMHKCSNALMDHLRKCNGQ